MIRASHFQPILPCWTPSTALCGVGLPPSAPPRPRTPFSPIGRSAFADPFRQAPGIWGGVPGVVAASNPPCSPVVPGSSLRCMHGKIECARKWCLGFSRGLLNQPEEGGGLGVGWVLLDRKEGEAEALWAGKSNKPPPRLDPQGDRTPTEKLQSSKVHPCTGCHLNPAVQNSRAMFFFGDLFCGVPPAHCFVHAPSSAEVVCFKSSLKIYAF